MPWNRRELLRTGLSSTLASCLTAAATGFGKTKKAEQEPGAANSGASHDLLKTSDNLPAAAGLNMDTFAAGTRAAQITPTRRELDEMGGGFSSGPLFPGGAAAPLWARALATRKGDQTLLLITADLHSTPLWMSNEIRAELSQRCHIPREAISLCTSQTHSAPYTSTNDREQPYNKRLVRELIEVGVMAIADLRPAKIGAIKGYDHGLCYNQRLPITDEVPLEACPDRDRHRGGCMFARNHVLGRGGGRPVDHELGVLRIDTLEGKPLAIVFHYNCHPATVIEGPSMHGDFSGFAAAKIEESCPGTTAMFLQGSLADGHPRYFFTDVEHARKNGLDLAHEVLRVLPEITTTDQVRMDFASENFPVTLVPYPKERLKRLLTYFKDFVRELEKNPEACWIGAGPDTINLPPRFPAAARLNMVTPLIRYCETKLAVARDGEDEKLAPLEGEIQTFVWNDIALCLHNWEMFCQTGLEIKRLSPLRYTFPVGNSNSLVGYVAPQEEFDLGGYEVVTNPMYANMAGMRAPENTERIIKRFMALLNAGAGS